MVSIVQREHGGDAKTARCAVVGRNDLKRAEQHRGSLGHTDIFALIPQVIITITISQTVKEPNRSKKQ
jgi:hypothetical protein